MGREFPDMVPVSDLRQTAASVLHRIKKTRQPVIITQRGRAAAIIMGVDEYPERSMSASSSSCWSKGKRK